MNIHCSLIFSGANHAVGVARRFVHHVVHHHAWHAVRRVAKIVCVAVGVGAPIGGGIAGAGYLSAGGHPSDLLPSFLMGPGALAVPAGAQAIIPSPELAPLPAPPNSIVESSPIVVAEPASFLLFATGLAGLALLRRRRA